MMRRVSFLCSMLFFLCDPASAATRQWAIYLPRSVVDEFGESTWKELRASRSRNEDGMPHLIRFGEATGRPLPLTIPTIRFPEIRGTVLNPEVGLFAVEADTIRDERDEDVIQILTTPLVAVMDTSGAVRGVFLNARDPDWSPDGTKLAFRVVRIPVMARRGRLSATYPEIAESVSIWRPSTDERRAYPAASEILGWRHNDLLTLSHSGRGYALESFGPDSLAGAPFYFNVEVRAGKWSPDSRFSLVQREGRAFTLWSQKEKRDLSAEILKRVGGGLVTIRGAFWVDDGPGSHQLCLGILRRDRGRSGSGSKRKEACEIIVIDVETLRIRSRFSGSFVAPSADRRFVVVRHRGAMAFEGVTSKN